MIQTIPYHPIQNTTFYSRLNLSSYSMYDTLYEGCVSHTVILKLLINIFYAFVFAGI